MFTTSIVRKSNHLTPTIFSIPLSLKGKTVSLHRVWCTMNSLEYKPYNTIKGRRFENSNTMFGLGWWRSLNKTYDYHCWTWIFSSGVTPLINSGLTPQGRPASMAGPFHRLRHFFVQFNSCQLSFDCSKSLGFYSCFLFFDAGSF